MAMIELGKKVKNMYDGPEIVQNEEKIVYPDVDLPLEVVEGMNLSVDDKVSITIEGRVSGLQDTKWVKRATFEAHKAEVKKTSKSDDKEES